MTTVVKLTQRVPNRSIFNKLFHYSNKTLSTFTKCHVYPSHIMSINKNIHSLNIYPSQHYRSFSTTQDKNNEEQQESEDEQYESEEEIESDESDEQNHTEKSGNFSSRILSFFTPNRNTNKSIETFSVGTKNENIEIEINDEYSYDIQIRNLELKISELHTEVKKYQDALARSHADIINIQNMNKKDVENARKFATKSFSKDMLNVADSLTGCIDAINNHINKTGEQMDENLKSVIDGVKITQNTLIDTFSRHGITKIESLHTEFDPNFHEALFKQPTNEHPPDTVVQVVAEGYAIKDTVLRAAKVGVATGMPQEQVQTQTQESDEIGNENDGEDKKEE
eukprot:2867_1